MALDPNTIVETLGTILPGPAVLHEPTFSGNEWDYVKECLDTGWVSSAGKYVDKFEDMLAGVTGAGHAIATVTGTAALHTALVLAGVKAGDEVIVPALTFVGTANAVTQAGAIPHFADSEERTLGLDPAKLDEHLSRIADINGNVCRNKKTGKRIAAVVCVHIFGHPVDLDALASVAGDSVVARVRWEPDADIQAIVSGWPTHFNPVRGAALGFSHDSGMVEIIEAFIEDELGGSFIS